MEESTDLKKDNLIGTWKLINFKIIKSNGKTEDWGPNSNGLLIYDKSGHMSTSINSGADNVTTENSLKDNILFYAGEYKVTGKNEITHYVTNASDPNRINKKFIRSAIITANNKLELSAEGKYGKAYLQWQKV